MFDVEVYTGIIGKKKKKRALELEKKKATTTQNDKAIMDQLVGLFVLSADLPNIRH